MKTSISNLAWNHQSTSELLPKLKLIGIQGVEIAPTLIWPDFEDLEVSKVLEFLKTVKDEGLSVSGIQSLSFGRPDLQVFDNSTWPAFREHLKKMFEVGAHLNASVAVFGSPKNRVKGELSELETNRLAVEFFESLIPDLIENNIKLTLEPNATAYGADFLINYGEVISLSQKINSPWIMPQIDTGCMWMSKDDLGLSFSSHQPGHIHLSLPNLEVFPGIVDFKPFLNQVLQSDYSNWLVIEMLNKNGDLKNVFSAAEELQNLIKELNENV